MSKVIVVDHTGRGHAYADWFVRTDPDVTVHLAPGCAAIAEDRIVPVTGVDIYDPTPTVAYAKEIGANYALVAHPRPLTEGFVDAFRAAGIPAIGPDRSATRVESSKLYTKRLCEKYGIATARYRYFESPEPAIAYVREMVAPVVVKCVKSCQGNGVFVCETADEAVRAIERLMIAREFGPGGETVLVEEKLVGRELLFFAIVGGEHHLMLPMAVDYPRSDDGNRGVMCGGMGAFSPSPDDTPDQVERFEQQLLRPLLTAMRTEGLRYTGVIYVGCMLVDDDLHLIEINARMGDPEAEVVFPRLTSNLDEICTAILGNRLGELAPLTVTDECFVNVVATQGPLGEYPGWPFGRYARDQVVTGLDRVDTGRCRVFHGAVRALPDGRIVTDGGKAMNFVGRGHTVEEAAVQAYRAVAEIDFPGLRYRTDIGKVMPWD